MYELTFKNKKIELPNYTMGMVEKIEELDKFTGSGVELLGKMYDYIEETIGAETTKELLGEKEECDVSDLHILFSDIIKCYKKPYEDHQLKEAGNIINSPQIQKSLEAIDKVVAANKKND